MSFVRIVKSTPASKLRALSVAGVSAADITDTQAGLSQ